MAEWSEWFSLGGQIKGEVSAAYYFVENPGWTNAFNRYSRWMDVWVRGADDGLRQIYWNGHQWVWVDHSRDKFKLGSSPTLVFWASNSRGIFATDRQGFLYENYWDGNRLVGWELMDKNFKAQIQGKVGALIPAEGTAELYMRSMDDKLWQANWDGASWHWIPHLGNYTLVSSPAVIFQYPEYRAVFKTEQGRVYQKYGLGRGQWTDWYGIGDYLTGIGGPFLGKGDASATFQDGDIVDVYMRGNEDRLCHNYWDGERWSRWKPEFSGIEFKLGASPTAVSAGTRDNQDLQVHVFARGQDGQLWHTYYE